jgi:hypothetical protein
VVYWCLKDDLKNLDSKRHALEKREMIALDYDEKAEPVEYNEPRYKIIQKLCPHPSYVNASLATHPTAERPFGIKISKEIGYGPLRFCRICKKVDCVHDFVNENVDEEHGKYHLTRHQIGLCRKCGRRIYRLSYGIHLANDAATRMMHDLAQQVGLDCNDYSKLGSYWYCELRTKVSDLIDAGRTTDAEKFILEFLGRTSISDAQCAGTACPD